jgi:hypothetical protein
MLEIGCPSCGRTLRVAEAHVGKQIRCPACQQISIAPEMAANAAAPEAPSAAQAERPATNWHVRAPDGPIYGPIAWDEVLAWADEGRIDADCQLARAGDGPWQAATELIPTLPANGSSAALGQAAAAPYPWTPAAVSSASAAANGYVAPHRGGLVLILGLLGLFSCAVFSVVAWVMGSHDLGEMRAGRMDRSGEGLTLTGMLLGMIVSIVSLVIVLIVSASLLIYAAARL